MTDMRRSVGVAKEGGKWSTTTIITTFNFSKENREEFEKTEGVKSSDFTTVSHELRHQYDYDQGNMKDAEAVSSAKDPA